MAVESQLTAFLSDPSAPSSPKALYALWAAVRKEAQGSADFPAADYLARAQGGVQLALASAQLPPRSEAHRTLLSCLFSLRIYAGDALRYRLALAPPPPSAAAPPPLLALLEHYYTAALTDYALGGGGASAAGGQRPRAQPAAPGLRGQPTPGSLPRPALLRRASALPAVQGNRHAPLLCAALQCCSPGRQQRWQRAWLRQRGAGVVQGPGCALAAPNGAPQASGSAPPAGERRRARLAQASLCPHAGHPPCPVLLSLFAMPKDEPSWWRGRLTSSKGGSAAVSRVGAQAGPCLHGRCA